MNSLLIRNRPVGVEKEDWEKVWINAGYSLSALYKTINMLKDSTDRVKEDDFSVANHYALLAFQAGKKAAYNEIVALLPDTAKE